MVHDGSLVPAFVVWTFYISLLLTNIKPRLFGKLNAMAQRPLTTAKISVSRNILSKRKGLIIEKVFDSWYHPLVVFLMKREKKNYV